MRVTPKARVVLGCNLPKAMPLQERRVVAEKLLCWCEWALGGPLLADRVHVPIQVTALGKDVAFVFMPGEPFWESDCRFGSGVLLL
jgi:hypothetical protein